MPRGQFDGRSVIAPGVRERSRMSSDRIRSQRSARSRRDGTAHRASGSSARRGARPWRLGRARHRARAGGFGRPFAPAKQRPNRPDQQARDREDDACDHRPKRAQHRDPGARADVGRCGAGCERGRGQGCKSDHRVASGRQRNSLKHGRHPFRVTGWRAHGAARPPWGGPPTCAERGEASFSDANNAPLRLLPAVAAAPGYRAQIVRQGSERKGCCDRRQGRLP